MAKKIVPSELKTHLIDQFLESVTEVANTIYYGFIGDHITTAATESDVRAPSTNLKTLNVDSYRNMIVGVKLNSDDFKPMIRRVNWTSGTVYNMYDDETLNLYDEDFYVVVDEDAYKHVYKCLYNANNAASTIQPTFSDVRYDSALFSLDDAYYETSDGYQWKYMYSVDSTTFDKFATENYIPVVANTTIERDAVNGSIDVIKIVTHGKNYNNYVSDQFTSSQVSFGNTVQYVLPDTSSKVTGFYGNTVLHLTSGTGAGQYKSVVDSYFTSNNIVIELESAFEVEPDDTTKYEVTPRVEIVGDGLQFVNAYAKAVINANASNSVHKVVMLEPGENYNYATASVLKGVPASAENTDSGDIVNPTDAVLRPIMPPSGGHGANTIVELGVRSFCMYSKFATDIEGTIPAENVFNQFGILRDPKFADIEVNHKKYNGVSGSDGTFLVDETVYQFKKILLNGNVTTQASNNTIVCNESASYDEYFQANDFVYIRSDDDAEYNFFGRVSSVTNSTAFVVDQSPSWSSANSELYSAKIISESKVKSVASTSQTNLKLCDSNLVTGQLIVGANSYAVANVSGIDINNRYNVVDSEYDFRVYNQTLRCFGTLGTGTTFINNERVYQGATVADATFTAYVHSSSDGNLYLTNRTGVLDTGSSIIGEDSGASLNSGFTMYDGDLDPTSGTIIYLQNDISVTRDSQQSEEIRVILEF